MTSTPAVVDHLPGPQRFDSADLFALVVGDDGRIRHANLGLTRCTGRAEFDLLGHDWLDALAPGDPAAARAAFAAWLGSEAPLSPLEVPVVDAAGKALLVRWHPCRLVDGACETLALLGMVVPSPRQTEPRQRRLTALHRALADMGHALAEAEAPQRLFESVCRIAVETGRARIASIGMLHEGHMVPLAWAAGGAEAGIDALSTHPLGELAGASPFAPPSPAWLDGRPWVCNDVRTDPQAVDWRERFAGVGVQSAAALPIRRGAVTAGVLNLGFGEAGAFDPALMVLVERMVASLSLALDRIDREAARAQAVQAAQEGFTRFRQLFADLPVPAAIFELDRPVFVDVNQAFARMTGLPAEALLGRSIIELDMGLGPEDRAAFVALIQRDGHVRDWEARLRPRQGGWREMLVNADVIDFLGRRCILNINIDITERKRYEEALREQELRLAGIVETAMDAIITIDAAQRIVVFNRAASEMFGVAPEEAIGGRLDRFLPPESLADHADHVRHFAEEGGSSRHMGKTRELAGRRLDGAIFPMESSISRTGEGDRMLLTVMARDVTRLRLAEKAQLDRVAAEAASRAKTEFLSRMSHELRTPLNAVLGFAQLMQSDAVDPLPAMHRDHLGLVMQAGTHLRQLIDEMLDVAGIEAGRMSVQAEEVDLAALLDGVLRMSSADATRCGVALERVQVGPVPVVLHTDPGRLRQVLLNLLSNAIKYNRPGGHVWLEAEGCDGERVRIAVRDDGWGMDAEQRAHLFEPFNRLGREHGDVPGSGIGLVLSKQLVALLGGTLDVDSAEGGGCLAEVRLPIGLASGLPIRSKAQPQAVPPPLPQGLVVYIEDNPVNATLVAELIARSPGTRLVVSEDGASGIAQVRALRPDVVLLDMQLPDMDGVAVLKALRADAATRHIPVIALSANGVPADVQAARVAGAADYWMKPIDFERFLPDLGRWMRGDALQEASA